MSWKVHETDEVFAALRGLCSNSYRMYDPSEHRHYYDHECDAYECAVEDAAREYERLLKHCNHQREQLAKRSCSQTIDILMELLNEYQESECAIAEDRVTYYANRLDGRTEDERMEERTRTEQNGVGITDELRESMSPCISDGWLTITKSAFEKVADRIDERYHRDMATAQQVGINEGEDAAMREGWVKLPVDADGVPIRLGDELTNGEDMPAKVRSMMLIEEGWMVSSQPRPGLTVAPNILRHHQPDSWERIIGDALTVGWPNDSWNEVASAEVHDRLVERCTSRG